MYQYKSVVNILSPAFDNNKKIPSKYTCDGENISPPLSFSNISQNTKSLVLIVDDPDAPSKTWVHWVIFNISPEISEIAEGSAPTGAIEGMTDFGSTGYGGPCPPSGVHRYVFKLYALDSMLDLPKTATKEDIEKKMNGHVLEKAELIGLYERG